MRLDPICHYIAAQLNTIVSLHTEDKICSKTYCSRYGFTDEILQRQDAKDFLLGPSPEQYPQIYIINQSITYVRVPAAGHTFYLIGPVRMVYTTSDAFARHHILLENISSTFSSSLVGTGVSALLSNALLLYNVMQEKDLDLWDCYQMNFDVHNSAEVAQQYTSTVLFENRENDMLHNPYDQEVRLMDSIENGNMEQLKASWNETYPGTFGVLCKDPVQNGRYLAIYNVAASARAAIRGGLQPEMVLTMTDSYSQQIDELKDMSVLEPLIHDLQLKLTQMVKESKEAQTAAKAEDPSPIIENFKTYVFRHLHSRLTVQEIAHELGVHPSYLTSLFCKQEGITPYRYILIQKIELTKNLLTYSDYSYIEIANYLGFASQSHLGAQFKSITGMTLKAYRDKYHKKDF